MKKRNLDGVFFRVFRDGKWDNVCFTDLTESEQIEMLSGWEKENLTNMCLHLARTIRGIGDQFDITKGF